MSHPFLTVLDNMISESFTIASILLAYEEEKDEKQKEAYKRNIRELIDSEIDLEASLRAHLKHINTTKENKKFLRASIDSLCILNYKAGRAYGKDGTRNPDKYVELISNVTAIYNKIVETLKESTYV